MNKKLMDGNFRENGKTYCIRCQKCGRENYAMNVTTGICTWCGEDHNLYSQLPNPKGLGL